MPTDHELPAEHVEVLQLNMFGNPLYAITDDGTFYIGRRQPGTHAKLFCELDYDTDLDWKPCPPSRIPKTVSAWIDRRVGTQENPT